MEAIYARQSLDKKDSLSIEGQIALCEREVQGAYRIYEDRGFSGKNTDRPGFLKLMQDVAAGEIGRIHVYRLDRFSRSISDFGRLMEKMDANGVEFVSVTERFDTSTAIGRAMLSIVMVFAQLERETIADRVRANYYQRFELGAWPGGPAPLGFDLGRTTDEMGRRLSTLVPNGSADLVRRIFALYGQEDTSLGSVAGLFNREGVPCMRRKTWDNVALSRVLHNPLYVMADEEVYWYFQAQGVGCAQEAEAFRGDYACHIVKGGKGTKEPERRLALANHYGIVSAELWLRCQMKLAENRQMSRLGAGKHSWLSGLLKCGACGYAVKLNLCGGRFYMICSGRSNYGACDASILAELHAVEAAVAGELERHLDSCPNVETPMRRAGELAQIEQRIERLVQALAYGTEVSGQFIHRELERLARERDEVVETEQKRETGGELERIVFSELDFEEKKLVARRLLQRVMLREGEVELVWRM